MRKFAVVRGVSWTVLVAAVALVALPCQADPINLSYYPVTPCRLADTRTLPNGQNAGPILQSGPPARGFVVQGLCGVPVGAKAVWVNVTAVGPSGQGYLTLYPSGTTQPIVSNLNFNAGEPALGNGSLVALGSSNIDLMVYAFVSPNGTVHMVLDVAGYFQ